LKDRDRVFVDHLQTARGVTLKDEQLLAANLAKGRVADCVPTLRMAGEVLELIDLNGAVRSFRY
jgi:hypothetical protein